MYARFSSTALNFARTQVFFSLNKRPPLRSTSLRSAMLLEMLQNLRRLLGRWMPGAQHMLLRGQRGRCARQSTALDLVVVVVVVVLVAVMMDSGNAANVLEPGVSDLVAAI